MGGVRVTAPSTACDSAPEMEKRFDVRALLLSPDANVVALLLSAPTAKPTESRFSDAPREGEARGGEAALCRALRELGKLERRRTLFWLPAVNDGGTGGSLREVAPKSTLRSEPL